MVKDEGLRWFSMVVAGVVVAGWRTHNRREATRRRGNRGNGRHRERGRVRSQAEGHPRVRAVERAVPRAEGHPRHWERWDHRRD